MAPYFVRTGIGPRRSPNRRAPADAPPGTAGAERSDASPSRVPARTSKSASTPCGYFASASIGPPSRHQAPREARSLPLTGPGLSKSWGRARPPTAVARASAAPTDRLLRPLFGFLRCLVATRPAQSSMLRPVHRTFASVPIVEAPGSNVVFCQHVSSPSHPRRGDQAVSAGSP